MNKEHKLIQKIRFDRNKKTDSNEQLKSNLIQKIGLFGKKIFKRIKYQMKNE